MKKIVTVLMLATMLAVSVGCSTAQRMPRDQGYGSPNSRPADDNRFEWEKATSSAWGGL